jgi:hypothetical protein
MTSTSKLNDNEYTKLLQDVNFTPANFEKIADALENHGIKQMYHALVNEDDILKLFTIPNLEIFWICRCHLVALDGSSSHAHLHALVQYKKGTHRAAKDRMKRNGQRFHPKTTFKRILCPDHAVGVLRYITCQDGQRKTKPQHTHYRRSVHGSWLLHKRSEKKKLGCADVRLGILRNLQQNLDEEWLKNNVSGHPHHLHHHETCLCEFGKIGRQKKAAANQKRRDFYKTERGQDIKKMYKDRAQNKKDIIKLVMDLKTGNNLAEVEKETILDLLKRMK